MNTNSTKPDALGISEPLEKIERTAFIEVSDDEINLRELFRTLWKGKWFILAVTAASAAISVAVALWIPNEYKAYAVLTPASASSTSSLSRLAGQFGGLAALAGANLNLQDEDDKTVAAMELIKSWGFQEKFIRDNELEVPVFASRGWDRSHNQLIIMSNLYDITAKKWVRKFDPSQGQTLQPSGWELYEKLADRITITQDKKTNLISMSVEFYSPYLAKEWVDQLVKAVNKHLQDRDRTETEKNIQYLEEKMSQTNLVEMKNVFARLLEEQTKNLMLTQVSDEYVLKTLVPAKVPEMKSSPKRALICIGSTLAGCLLSTFVWVLWSKFAIHRGVRD